MSKKKKKRDSSGISRQYGSYLGGTRKNLPSDAGCMCSDNKMQSLWIIYESFVSQLDHVVIYDPLLTVLISLI